MAESSNCLGDSTGGVEVACPVGVGGVARARGGETNESGEGSEKSLGEEAGEAGASEGCMESGTCPSAMSLSCALLKIKARVQVEVA